MSTFQFRGKIGNWKRKSNKHLTKLKKREKKIKIYMQKEIIFG